MIDKNSSAKSARGSCLCGAVEYQVYFPTRWCVHCHCSMCRAAHGAAFVTWVGVLRDQFEFISGEKYLTWYESSETAFRGHCNRCGSPLVFHSSRWADEIHVTFASFENAIDRSPAAHVWFDNHVDWVRLGDDLRCFPELP